MKFVHESQIQNKLEKTFQENTFKTFAQAIILEKTFQETLLRPLLKL